MKNRKVYVTTFCGVAVAMNIVLGIITSAIGIPLYLDTLGTVLSAAILGPVPGLIVGALSNIITGLIYSVSDIPFCLVSMAVGLIVGLVAKKWKFGIVPAIITGLALSFICPAIGTPIGSQCYVRRIHGNSKGGGDCDRTSTLFLSWRGKCKAYAGSDDEYYERWQTCRQHH